MDARRPAPPPPGGGRARAARDPTVPLRAVLAAPRVEPRGDADHPLGRRRGDAAHDPRGERPARGRRPADGDRSRVGPALPGGDPLPHPRHLRGRSAAVRKRRARRVPRDREPVLPGLQAASGAGVRGDPARHATRPRSRVQDGRRVLHGDPGRPALTRRAARSRRALHGRARASDRPRALLRQRRQRDRRRRPRERVQRARGDHRAGRRRGDQAAVGGEVRGRRRSRALLPLQRAAPSSALPRRRRRPRRPDRGSSST